MTVGGCCAVVGLASTVRLLCAWQTRQEQQAAEDAARRKEQERRQQEAAARRCACHLTNLFMPKPHVC